MLFVVPSLNFVLAPQAITAPLSRRAREMPAPAAICDTPFRWPSNEQWPTSAVAAPHVTWTGVSLVSLVPSPSWPPELSPQAKTVPSDLSAKLYEMPAFTMTILESGTRAASATGTQSATAEQMTITASPCTLLSLGCAAPEG